MNLSDSNSFFNHSDFNFAESVLEESQQGRGGLYKIKTYHDTTSVTSESSNSLNLILFNNEAILGDKLHGAVKIFAERYLPPGRIVLVMESTLKINKPVAKSKLKMNQYLNQYRNYIHEKKLERQLQASPNQMNRKDKKIHKIKKKLSFLDKN